MNQHSGEIQIAKGSHLIAADGAHSVIRQQLDIPMIGTSMTGPWYLADVPMRTNLREDEAHINALPGGGFQFFLRVVEDRRAEKSGPALWRVIGLQPNFLQTLKLGDLAGPPVWESSFHVVHKIAARLSKGQVFFAGDAAHLHSPIGARGMNLGIEDVWVLAQLMKQKREHEYAKLRHAVDSNVVHRIERLSNMAAAKSSPFLWTRKNILIPALHLPPLQRVMTTTIAGLDHSVGI